VLQLTKAHGAFLNRKAAELDAVRSEGLKTYTSVRRSAPYPDNYDGDDVDDENMDEIKVRASH